MGNQGNVRRIAGAFDNCAFDNKVALTDDGAFGNCAFDNKVVLTDDGAFGNCAFDNKVVLTDDGAFGNEVARMISLCSIIESNSYLRSPKSKQTKSWFTFGGPIKNPTHIHHPIKSQFPRSVAFGNMVARTDALHH